MFKKIVSNFLDSHVDVASYIERMRSDFSEGVGFRYPDDQDQGSEYQYVQEITKDYLSQEINYLSPEITLTRLRSWYLDNCYYQLMDKQDSAKALEYYKRSTYYGFMAIKTNHIAIKCQFPYRVNYYTFALVNSYMSQCLIAGWDDEFHQIASLFYTSIKQKDLDRASYVNEHDTIYLDFDTNRFDSVWFLYYLYRKTQSIEIEIGSDYTTVPPYQDVVDNWDTQDFDEIEKLVYIASEYHMEKTKESTTLEQLNNAFNNPLYWLFPYEILTWLKLRERAGLKNPKTFTHPLMNTPIAKMFLDIKEPLPKPKELPYAKELLEKLKEKCPDVEIPE